MGLRNALVIPARSFSLFFPYPLIPLDAFAPIGLFSLKFGHKREKERKNHRGHDQDGGGDGAGEKSSLFIPKQI
jgi:hypothetical protein